RIANDGISVLYIPRRTAKCKRAPTAGSCRRNALQSLVHRPNSGSKFAFCRRSLERLVNLIFQLIIGRPISTEGKNQVFVSLNRSKWTEGFFKLGRKRLNAKSYFHRFLFPMAISRMIRQSIIFRAVVNLNRFVAALMDRSSELLCERKSPLRLTWM